MKKTYQGSCHCGAVRFECEADLSAGSMRCNCKFCSKARFWMTLVPAGDFRLVQGLAALTDYQHTPKARPAPFLHLQFCSTCGVRPFTRGGPLPAFKDGFYAVNIACFDDVPDEELAHVPIRFPDGRNDAWDASAAHSYL